MMRDRLLSFDWDQVLSLKSANTQMDSFQQNLFSMFSESFPQKTKIFFNESQEYFTVSRKWEIRNVYTPDLSIFNTSKYELASKFNILASNF